MDYIKFQKIKEVSCWWHEPVGKQDIECIVLSLGSVLSSCDRLVLVLPIALAATVAAVVKLCAVSVCVRLCAVIV